MADPIPSLGPWADVRVALTSGVTNPTTIQNGSVIQGVTLATGDRFACVGARTDAGIYTVGSSASTRSTDADAASEFAAGRRVRVLGGDQANQGYWVLMTQGTIVLGSTSLTISYLTAEPIDGEEAAFTDVAPVAISIAGTAFTTTPPVPISTATSTTVYYGIASNATLTEAQAKSALLPLTKSTVAGNYVCSAGEYKYLAVPASMTAPTAIRDLATGFAITLAGSADGYGNTTSNLNHASLSIDGITYRVYRSANKLGASVTLQVS